MRKLLVAVFLLAAILLAPLLVMRSERALLFLSDWAIDSFTDLRLVIRDPVLRPLQGKVSASEIHLYPKADDGPPFLSVLDFSGEVDVLDVYRGDLANSALRAAQVILYVSERDQTSDPEPRAWLKLVGWLPEQLEIAQFHLITAAENTFIFPLRALRGHRSSHDHFSLATSAQYDGEPLQLEADVSALRSWGRLSGLGIGAEVFAPQSGSRIKLQGELKGDAAEFNYNFRLDGDYAELADFMRGFDAAPPLGGSLLLRASLQGDTESFSLSEAQFELDNAPDYQLKASGKLNYRFSGENSLELNATGQLQSMALLLDWLDLDLTPLGSASGEAAISGSLQQPRIDNFELHSESDSGLNVTVGGDFNPLAPEAEKNAVRIKASGPAFSTMQHWTGALPFEPGPFTASARLLQQDSALALEDLEIEVGEAESVRFLLNGAIGSLGQSASRGLAAIAEADLRLAVSTADTTHLAQYLGDWVPPGLAFEGEVRASGSGEALNITGGKLLAYKGNDRLVMIPRSGTIEVAKDFPLLKLLADLELELEDTAILSAFTGSEIPSLGRLRGSAQLKQFGTKFALPTFNLQLTGGGLSAEGDGKMPDLTNPLETTMDIAFRLHDPKAFAALSDFKLSPGDGEVSLQNEGDRSIFSARLQLGATELQSKGQIDYAGGSVSRVSLSVDSPVLHLVDLGLQAEEDEQAAYKPAENLDDLGVGNRLEQRLQKAPRYETDLRLDLGGVVGDNTRIDGLQVHLTGLDNRYTLRRFSVAYDNSQAELRGIIDLNTSPPFASVAVEALAIPMNTLTRDLGIDYPVSGSANLRGGLTAQGSNGTELLQNLDGSIAVALEDTEIAGAAYDVLATDLLAWFYSGAALEKSTHIDCTMAEFKLKRGVAASDNLYIETTKMLATGKATINFRGEKLDVTFTPRSKSRDLQIPSTVHIKGPFKDPSVTVSPIAAAFDATAEVLSLVPRMARTLFGLNKKEGDKRPCVAGPQSG